MKLHHLISDGWSQVLLCNKLQKIYLDLLEGRTVQLPPAPGIPAACQRGAAVSAKRRLPKR